MSLPNEVSATFTLQGWSGGQPQEGAWLWASMEGRAGRASPQLTASGTYCSDRSVSPAKLKPRHP